jgi:hypothetical protein
MPVPDPGRFRLRNSSGADRVRAGFATDEASLKELMTRMLHSTARAA